MEIVRLENGNVELRDGGVLVWSMPKIPTEIKPIDKQGEDHVKLFQSDGRLEYLNLSDITETQLLPDAAVPFSGNVYDLASLLSSSFFVQPSSACSKILQGFIDYNDTSSAAGIALPANVWVDIPNNGLGAFSNNSFLPQGVTDLIDTTTGYLDCSQLKNGDDLIIRNDFIVTPNNNRANLFFRYSLGTGLGAYTLEKRLDRLDSGAGIAYRFNLNTDYIYMGDDNTRLNPIKMQLKLSKNGTFVNNGSAIKPRIR